MSRPATRARRPPRAPGSLRGTCRLFAAGYDIRAPAGFARALAECEAAVGLRRVLAVHLNDARAPLGSGLDRHEHIGRGHLGLRPFRLLLDDPRLARIPEVLETPRAPDPQADLRDLATLRRLRLGGRRRRPSGGRRAPDGALLAAAPQRRGRRGRDPRSN